MSKKELLVAYGQRRRPVAYVTSDEASTEYSNLLQAVTTVYADMVIKDEGSSQSASGEWYLQKESAMWGMVDVTEANVQQLVNRSTIFIVRSAGSDGGNSDKKVCSYNNIDYIKC